MSQKNNYQFSQPVYFIESPQDQTVLLALDITIKDGYIYWFDTIKERIMEIDNVIETSPNKFVFQRAGEEGGGVYTFSPLTLEIYNNRVKRFLLIPRDFTTSEEMLKAFSEKKGVQSPLAVFL